MPDPRINYRISATDDVSRTIKGIDSRIAGLTKSFRTLGGFAGFATVAASVRALAGQLLTLGGELQDASDKLGISAQSLQVLRRVAEEAGGSFESLQTALAYNAKLTSAAAAGNKEAAATFRQLGLDARKFADLAIEDRFRVLAQQISSVESPAERLALTLKAFGRGGADLAGVMSKTAAELDVVAAKVQATNGILSNEQVKALDEAGEAWERFKSRLLASAAPAFTATIGFIEATAAALKALNEQRLFVTNQGFEIVELLPKGPQRRRGGGALTPDQAAAIVGAPNRADVSKGLDALRATITDFDAWLADHSIGAKVAERTAADIAAIIERNEVPLEAYRRQVAEVQELISRGLAPEQAVREIQRLGAVLGEQTQAMVDATEAGAAWKRNIEDAAEIADSTVSSFDRLAMTYKRIADLEAGGFLDADIAGKARSKALEEFASQTDKVATQAETRTTALLESIKNATEGYASDITDIFFDTTKSIGDMFEDLLNRIARMLVEKNIVQPLLDAALAGLGGLFGGGISEIDISKLPKRRALGGPVFAGEPYLVGERGPELFMPRQSGQIIPNGSGGAALAINFTVNSLDPRSAAAVIAENERTITNVIRRAQVRAGYRPTV